MLNPIYHIRTAFKLIFELNRHSPVHKARLAHFNSHRAELQKILNIPYHLGELTPIDVIKYLDYSDGIVHYFLDGGDTVLTNYELGENCIIFDVGAYKGEWTAGILKRCKNSFVHLFEPDPSSFSRLSETFADNPLVILHPFGLSNKDTVASMNFSGLGSSLHLGPACGNVELRDIYRFITDNRIGKIDLVKINIEGEEYALLDRMIETEIIKRCGIVQVQFHEWFPNSTFLRDGLRLRLAKTHRALWNYPFVWESWKLL